MERTKRYAVACLAFLSVAAVAAACDKGGDEGGGGPVPEKLVETDVSEAAAEAFPAYEGKVTVLAPEGAEVSTDNPLTVSVTGEGFALELVTGVPDVEERKADLDEGAIVEEEEKALLFKSDLGGGYAVHLDTPSGVVCRTPLTGDALSEAQARKVLEACKGVKVE